MNETAFTLLAACLLIPLLLVLVRVSLNLPATTHLNNEELTFDINQSKSEKKKKKISILLGSGGHTGEMIRILERWDENTFKNIQREYFISSEDSTSILKLKKFEDAKNDKDHKYKISTIYRARNVGEGKLKAIVNTLISFQNALKIFSAGGNQLPDLLLTNGPGTAIPIAYTLFIFKLLGICNTKIVYVESLARVKKLSLTGLLLLPIANRMIVQWPDLAKKYRKCEYYGILV